MENLFFSRLIVSLLCFLTTSTILAQDSFVVFKKLGRPTTNGEKYVEKGIAVTVNDTLFLERDDYLLLVDRSGELFELKTSRKYIFSEIKNFAVPTDTDSFTKKYFSYVWNQFTNKNKIKQQIGVVYRENMTTVLLSPKDSSTVFAPEIEFKWQNKEEADRSYFFLKDSVSGKILKFGVKGTTFLLYTGNEILRPGKVYEWSVTTKAFPDLNQLKFNRLKILTKKEFEAFKVEMDVLIEYLSLLGFSKEEIKRSVCADYHYCFND